jgi:hypothetical protein
MPTAFVDANVLVYAAEEMLPLTAKTLIARDLLRQPDLALSVQVLGEFIVSARHPQRLGLAPATESAWLGQFMQFKVASLTPDTLILALEGTDLWALPIPMTELTLGDLLGFRDLLVEFSLPDLNSLLGDIDAAVETRLHPQLLAATILGLILKNLFDSQAIWALVLGGVSFFIAAAFSLRVTEPKVVT